MSFRFTNRSAIIPRERSERRDRFPAKAFRAVSFGVAFVVLGACNNLLDVDNPGSVPAESLSDPALAPALAAAALQTLQCGVIQYAATASMLSGEQLNANGFV